MRSIFQLSIYAERSEYALILPLKLTPAFKDYLWGGTKLRDKFGKSCSFKKIAESWELSCHCDGQSVVSDTGETLSDYIAVHGRTILGSNCERFSEFPVLVKLIDACDNLSVQVHPDEAFAAAHEGDMSKTEMWYILDCDDNASLIYGFRRNISEKEFSESIRNNTFSDLVQQVPVKKGDVFFIEAGTVHAIGKGILVAEIQQSSNTTYRIYDYERRDSSGNLRELHTEKACRAARLTPSVPCPSYETEFHSGFSIRKLVQCRWFTVHLLEIQGCAELYTDSSSFEHLLVTEGNGTLIKESCRMVLNRGDSIFIPAGTGSFTVAGNCCIIKTRVD